MQRSIVGAVVAGWLLAACVATPPASPPANGSPTASGASTVPAETIGSPEPSLDLTGLDDATRTAVEIRISFGLRHDLDYIRQVAADRTATDEFGTPLLPAETREIFARSERADRIVPIVQQYGQNHLAVYGGVWIDQPAGGVVTTSFTDDLGPHRAALAALLDGNGAIVVVQARYSESALMALQNRIVSDSAWFETIPAKLMGVGSDTIGNEVDIDVSTANPNITELIVTRLGIPADAIEVHSDGTGIAMEPWGKIHGRVVDVPVAVLTGLSIDYRSDRVGADCGSEVGLGLGPAGTFELPCQAGHWVIEAGRTIDDVVARGEVDLVPGGEATVTLRPIAP